MDEANGDLLDAMILLEKQGKVEAPKSESYSTKYEDNVQYPVVVEQCGKTFKNRKRKIKCHIVEIEFICSFKNYNAQLVER